MKTPAATTAAALFACACARSVPAEAPTAQSNDPAAIDAIKHVEQDMGDAMMASDIGRLAQIYADDYATVASSGEVITKKNLLGDFESFHDKLLSFENGPMDVQVFGQVAVAQGSVTEKRTRNGEDTSGAFAWMDLLENHAGKWVVVRSAAARVTAGDSPGAQSQDATAAEAIVKFEQDVGDAMVAFDVDKLDQSYADDWAQVRRTGDVFTKANLLGDFRSRKHTLVSFELGPTKVRVFGDVAMVHARVAEKRVQDGKDISGKFVFMDLLKKRGGKWVIFRTLAAKVS